MRAHRLLRARPDPRADFWKTGVVRSAQVRAYDDRA